MLSKFATTSLNIACNIVVVFFLAHFTIGVVAADTSLTCAVFKLVSNRYVLLQPYS